VLVSRKPFSRLDMSRAQNAIQQSGMQTVYFPGTRVQNEFGQLLTSSDPEAFYRTYRYDVSPVTDDRPFFFYTVQPRDVLAFLKGPTESADYKINRAVPLLFSLVGVSLVATAVILLLPPVVLRSRLPRERGVMTFLPYFACIGIGYILIQVALIQKFVLLLGHPTYALTVIIFSMLVASGLGSYFSYRFLAEDDERLVRLLVLVCALVTALAFLAPIISNAAISWPLTAKFVVTAGLIAPAAFAMGMPFPTGLRRLERRHTTSVRWAWALNAASSVLGSATAIFLAIYIGLRNTLLIGGVMYVLAAVCILATRSRLPVKSADSDASLVS
jgi:hypothetical protein